jgi:hypothetical protein
MIRRVLPWLIAIVLIAALGAACSKQDAGTATDAANASAAPTTDSTAAASTAKLTVTAPAGWAPSKYNPDMMMKGTATYSITEESMSGAPNPDAYLALAKTNFQKAFKNCVIGSGANLQVSGNEARRLEFTGEASGLAMQYILLYVFKDGRAHLLTCGATADTFRSVKAEYEAMIASAKLE